MNFKEIVNKIRKTGVNSLCEDEIEPSDLGLELVHIEGGFEGAGEHAERVFKHMNEAGEAIFVRITGYYSSYEGTEWDEKNIEEVKPEQKTITVYVSI